MAMTLTPREAMNGALKDAITQHLRPGGSTGSLPHLRRRPDSQVCLISFQFFSAGGSFAVEVAECGADGFTTSLGEHKAAHKVTAQGHPTPRPRLGTADFPQGDRWFVFGPRNYEPGAEKLQPHSHYEALADEVVRFVESQAEPFWQQQLSARLR
jgi:hypothetical protein